MNFSSKCHFYSQLPEAPKLIQAVSPGSDSNWLVIYDKKLQNDQNIKSWLQAFEFKYEVESGEVLKDIKNFPEHIDKIFALTKGLSHKSLTIVALGGGSVGDFAGFIASVYKRGVHFVQIPTTWLAAADSAHGGKTALNIGNLKNQLGSFYPASDVILIKEVFSGLSKEQEVSALGEFLKMGIVQKNNILAELHSHSFENLTTLYWQLLQTAIQGKMQIVLEDPFEEFNVRQKLNLGHTLGHALELKYNMPHGVAVFLGTKFSYHWSLFKNLVDDESSHIIKVLYDKYDDMIGKLFLNQLEVIFDEEELKELLCADKKLLTNEHLNYIFIHAIGKVSVEKVKVDDIVLEAKRQGWVK